MYEIVWQYDETAPYEDPRPDNAAEARRMLLEGNQAFARFLAPHSQLGETTSHVLRVSSQDVGISDRPGEAPIDVYQTNSESNNGHRHTSSIPHAGQMQYSFGNQQALVARYIRLFSPPPSHYSCTHGFHFLS